MTARPAMIRLERIEPHPDNVREHLGNVHELAQSIRANGMLQPVTVEPYGDRFRLVAGHRRVAAARLAGMREVPAVIRDDLLPEQVIAAMLVENIRASLTPVEEARALDKLHKMGVSNLALARQVGRSAAWVCYRLALLELAPAELAALERGERTLYDVKEQVTVQRRVAAGKAPTAAADRGWDNSPWHLSGTHPLAAGAKRLCAAAGHNNRRRLRSTACGACWEDVIRADEQRREKARRLAGTQAEPLPEPAAAPPVPRVRRQYADDVAVQRACDGDRSIRLNIAERREAVRLLHRHGLSDSEIGERIGMTARSVLRIRQELDLPAVPEFAACGKQGTA